MRGAGGVRQVALRFSRHQRIVDAPPTQPRELAELLPGARYRQGTGRPLAERFQIASMETCWSSIDCPQL